MFSGKGLFKGIKCPKVDKCDVLSCIFAHEEVQEISQLSAKQSLTNSPWSQYNDEPNALAEGDRKRVRLQDGSKSPAPTAQEASVPLKTAGTKIECPKNDTDVRAGVKRGADGAQKLESMSRAVSPPLRKTKVTKRGKDAKSSTGIKVRPVETLNPRLVHTHPAPHTVRLELLKAFHKELVRLNQLVSGSEAHKDLHLSPQELIVCALDEEEKVALTQPKVYKNILTHTIVRYRKMNYEQYIALKRAQAKPDEEERIQDPDLKPAHEVLMLACYHANLESLAGHGYIMEAPSDVTVAATRFAHRRTGNVETCERCGRHIQVFPEEPGKKCVVTGESCRFHWSRKSKESGTLTYPCCGNPIGSEGCTTHFSHVFKTSDLKRLADALQFQTTPENPKADPTLAVALDCEMGYTSHGMELIRLSAVKWPSGEKLMDVLVQPVGTVLDPTRQDFAALAASDRLHIMQSPAAARELFFSYISPQTPLIGHAIENDLTAMRVIHPVVIDSALLYPHRSGLPYRLGLKHLAKLHLDRYIQVNIGKGHDSLEDARATGDLVRVKIREDYKFMKIAGWTIDRDGFKPPGGYDEVKERKPVNEFHEMAELGWWMAKSGQTKL
jgi:RNA exonuclease 1